MKRRGWFTFGALFFAGLLLSRSWSADTGTPPPTDTQGRAIRSETIRVEPFVDARDVGTLAKDEVVEICGKEGGWLRITSARGNGWVRLLAIRRGGTEKPRYTADGVLGLASGRAGTGKVVATTGIRGLSEEDLQAARFNEAQVVLLESFGVTRAQAREFAARGSLVARPFPYLTGKGAP